MCKQIPILIAILFLFDSCEQRSDENASYEDSENPLLKEWSTPYGVPPFDEIKDEHYYSAFQAAMAEHKKEVEAITNSADDPTFANTIEALEYTGKTLNKVASVFFAINGAHSNDSTRGVARVIAPELSAHRDDITLNRKLFDKVKMVFEQIDNLNLDPQQRKLLEDTHKTFIRSGVNVKKEDQPRLREINKTLAEFSQQFGENLLAETNDFELHVTNEDDLINLPQNLVAAAKKEAERREKEEGWVFTLSRPSINPFLQYSPNRDLREQIFNGYALRGDNNNEHDNKVILSKMAALRAERAKLMGYETHAHYVLSDNMAENPDRVYKLLDQIWEPALAIAKLERKAIEEMMKADGIEDQLRGSDWRYYTEKVRKARYDFDEEIIKPYFEVTAVREGAFVVANKLFGLTFEELFDLPKWHPEQQVFEVKEADGSHLGILYMDFFTRESKRGGAWMNSLRSQSKGISPIVTNNFNFPPPTDESPSLLSFTEAQTLFHEFGHALHGLFSKVIYESHSGTSVPRDFVEFPSQVMENWMGEPEVLRMFARHYETGEIIPDRLIDKISASGKFNQGFGTVEYMAASYLDMAWHTLKSPEQKEAREFEENHMKRIGLIAEIIPRYRSTYFAHIFNGGYSSGYYSYIWSEVLDADAFQAFKETDLFNQEMAAKYRKMLSQGGSKPGMELYEEFRGRQPEIGPLLEKRGLSGTN